MRKLINYLRPSFEGEDGKLSYRRASAFVVLTLIVGMTIRGFVNEYDISALYGLIAFFLILTGIITADQLIRFKNGEKQNDS